MSTTSENEAARKSLDLLKFQCEMERLGIFDCPHPIPFYTPSKQEKPRYEIVIGSQSSHPEFEASIIENIEPQGVRLVCECATLGDAKFICESMNYNNH